MISVESGGDSMRIRQVVVGVEVAIHVDIPRIEVAVVHMQATERTGPEIRASCRVIPKNFTFPFPKCVLHHYPATFQS